MARKPFKKDLTPLTKGGSIKTHTGKGAREQSRDFDGNESLTGGNPYQSAANQYPKSEPEPEEPPPQEEPPVPMGPPPARAPTAMMPPSGGGGGGAPDAGGEDEPVA